MLGKSKKIRMTRLDDDSQFVYVYKFQIPAYMSTGWIENVGVTHVYDYKGPLNSSGLTNWFGKATAEKMVKIKGVFLDFPDIWAELTLGAQLTIATAMASPAVALLSYLIVHWLTY